jgi:hypothetical protein
MDTNKIELTPEQKGVLVALSQKTGEPVGALLNKVFEELQERMQTPKKGSLHLSRFVVAEVVEEFGCSGWSTV